MEMMREGTTFLIPSLVGALFGFTYSVKVCRTHKEQEQSFLQQSTDIDKRARMPSVEVA
jgi:hypothetical protein